LNIKNNIKSRHGALTRTAVLLVSTLLVLLVVMPNFAQDYGQINPEEATTEATTARVSKQQLREALMEMLADPTATASKGQTEQGSSGGSYDQGVIDNWQQSKTNQLGEKLARLVRKLPDYPEDFSRAMALSSSDEFGWSGFSIFLTIVGVAVIGLLVAHITTRRLLKHLYLYVDSQEKTTSLKYRFIAVRVIIQLIGVAVLALITYGGAIYFRNGNPYFELLFTEIIGALVMLRLWMILLRNIFTPKRPSLRPIPLDDATASDLYRWFIVFFIIIEFGGALFTYLTRAGMSEAQLNGLLIPYTLSLNLIILSRVWTMRKKITAMFTSDSDNGRQQSLTREALASTWPFMFTAWLLTLWMLWLYKAFMGLWQDADYVSISWWITLAFFVADRIFYGLVRNVVNIQWLQSPSFDMRSARFIRIVQNGFRLLMIAVAIYTFSLAWGLSPEALMERDITDKFLAKLIDLLVIATITYIIWEFFNALIERQLPEETDALASLEGDAGGAGATRAETLLPLTRTFLTVMLFCFVLLSVLHSLGIAITPLLAGAGVVGIAIGFGAQKLVQDVLSGIFFLIDDAFRKNEYIEIEQLRGTVEKISLRSMQLRHHLGAVQTIPYGEIKTVKNLSRDWVTMKLELRLSYDTDIEQVRKIIKRVGQEMIEDSEMGPSFILPLKSQGVMRVEESALIVRMKFTTKPGEQWVIRREAYRKVRDALADAGIFFAHREVRVRLPDDQLTAGQTESSAPTKELIRNAGAAAANSESQEANKHGKIDHDNDM